MALTVSFVCVQETADEGVGGGTEIDSTPSLLDHPKSNSTPVSSNVAEREMTLGNLMNGLITVQLSKPASQPSNLTQVKLFC